MQESISKEDLIGKLEDYKVKVSTLFIHVFTWTSQTPGDKYKILLFLLFFYHLLHLTFFVSFQAQERQKKLELELAELKNKVRLLSLFFLFVLSDWSAISNDQSLLRCYSVIDFLALKH